MGKAYLDRALPGTVSDDFLEHFLGQNYSSVDIFRIDPSFHFMSFTFSLKNCSISFSAGLLFNT